MNRQYKYDTIRETIENAGNKPKTIWKVLNQNRTITVRKSRNRRNVGYQEEEEFFTGPGNVCETTQ